MARIATLGAVVVLVAACGGTTVERADDGSGGGGGAASTAAGGGSGSGSEVGGSGGSGGASSGNNVWPLCTPGNEQDCTCSGSVIALGVSTCSVDGDAWGDCVCPGVAAGGSTGSGGASVTGGTGGVAGSAGSGRLDTSDPNADPCQDYWTGRSVWVDAAGACLVCPPGMCDCDYDPSTGCEYNMNSTECQCAYWRNQDWWTGD